MCIIWEFQVGCFSFVGVNCFITLFTGGMEELSLDQIKKKSDLEKNVDFERSNSDLQS